MATQLNLEELGINASEDLTVKNFPVMKKLAKKVSIINKEIADLCFQEDEEDKEMLKIKNKIQQQCSKLIERQKEIKQNRKIFTERRLMLLGERLAYYKEFKELGANVDLKDFTKIVGDTNLIEVGGKQ